MGQGDATLISVNGQRLLIDGGRSQNRIEERLSALGITDLDAIMATHPDADHIAGLIRVLELYTVETVYLNGGESDSQTFATFMAAVNAEGADVLTLSRGDAITLGGLTIEVLHPGANTGDSNADSLVVHLTCGSVDVLLTGDATLPSEASMIAAGVLSDVEVLKVGHHGSNTSTGQAFLDIVQPEYAVISAGMESQFGHPHEEVVTRLVATGATLYHTDTTAGDDTVVMSSDCSSVSFDTAPWDPDVEVTVTPTATPTTVATATPTSTSTPTATMTATSTPTSGGCVNINTASHEDLQQIIHIGPERATEIIQLRPFASVDGLDEVSGIGPSRLQDIKNQGLACV